MEQTEELGLTFTLPIGLKINDQSQKEKDVELLRTNGIAEKVFTQKMPSKPYTWYANIISIACKSIGSHVFGATAREEYLKEGAINVPQAVKKLYFADANSLVVEIHRRLWQNLIPDQNVMCIFCTKSRIMDIDLNRIAFDKRAEVLLDQLASSEDNTLIVDLKDGFEFIAPIKNSAYDDYEGMLINRFTFRLPTLGDAVKNESDVVDDDIQFWRQIAFDCMIGMAAVHKDGTVIDLPKDVNALLGLRLYNTELTSRDLRKIREALRDTVPTLPFAYEEDCGCPKHKTIPVVMEASAFFSE